MTGVAPPERHVELSVVIPTLNGAATIGGQLAALRRQTTSATFEVIVSDNGSTDATAEIARGFAPGLDVVVRDSSEHQSRGYACNVGAQAARGRSIVFLDDDDVVADDYLEAMLQALREHEFVAARIDLSLLNPGWRASVRDITQVRGLAMDPFPFGYGATLGVRRDVFERIGGFSDEFRGSCEDVDLCCRMAHAGVGLVYVPDAVLNYRLRDSWRSLYRQGRGYGRNHRALERVHPELTIRLTTRSGIRGFVASARMAVLSSSRPTRWRGAFLLGRRIGLVEGWWRERLRHR